MSTSLSYKNLLKAQRDTNHGGGEPQKEKEKNGLKGNKTRS
jgi:hypothetical protein